MNDFHRLKSENTIPIEHCIHNLPQPDLRPKLLIFLRTDLGKIKLPSTSTIWWLDKQR